MSKIEDLQKELQEVKEQLRNKKILFDSILEGTFAGYWDWYVKDDYEFLSPTFKRMFGYEDHEMKNSPDAWQKIIHPDDLPGVFEIFEKHVSSKGKIPYDSEVRYFHKDGSIVWVYCRGKVIEWDEDGSPLRMVGCHVDITKLKEAEQTEKYVRLLEQKNHELQQFAYVASHDLQEPLRTINSFVEIFEEENAEGLNKDGKRYLKYISSAASRMSNLVKDLLDYSRLGKDRERNIVNCQTIIEEVKSDLETVIKENGAKISVGKLPTFKGYSTEIRVLFQNLLSNAIKFKQKDKAPEISIKVTEKSKVWEFSVSDNGIGIAEEHHEKIFIIFQRLHNKSLYEGTGIGLAHCRKIVELHSGNIRVESELGKGSTFIFTIEK